MEAVRKQTIASELLVQILNSRMWAVAQIAVDANHLDCYVIPKEIHSDRSYYAILRRIMNLSPR